MPVNSDMWTEVVAAVESRSGTITFLDDSRGPCEWRQVLDEAYVLAGRLAAFGVNCPNPSRKYELDAVELDLSARKADRHERAFSVSNMYLEAIKETKKLDSRPKVAVCIVPNDVFENCRIESSVGDRRPTAKAFPVLAVAGTIWLPSRRLSKGTLRISVESWPRISPPGLLVVCTLM